MTSKRLRSSGFLSMLSALLAVPWYILVFHQADRSTPLLRTTLGLLLVAGTILLVYLISTFRSLLNSSHSFYAADPWISLLIKGNIVLAFIALVGLAASALEPSAAIVSVILAIPLGIAQMLFGRTLLTLPDDLSGLRSPYAYITVITGFCQAIVFLMPVALFTGAVADVMLGTIFFQAARGKREIHSNYNQE